MSRESYWEGCIHPFLTDENARRKWEQLLPSENFSVLAEFHPRTKLQILRWLDWQEHQDMDALNGLIQTAHDDYRDIGIAEWPLLWASSFDVAQLTREEEEAIQEKDASEYVAWLSS